MPTSSITYPRPLNSSAITTELETEYRITIPSPNKTKIEVYATLDPANVPQVNTVTISTGSEGDEYAIGITVNNTEKVYRHRQTATDTATTIADFLTTLINTDSNVHATAATGVITIKSLIPGQAFTVDVSESATPANLEDVNTVENVGNVLHRKISEAEVTFSVSTSGFPVISISGKWFDGAATPVQRQLFGPLTGVGGLTMDAIQTAAGITRPTV